jgi:hypothetical protein
MSLLHRHQWVEAGRHFNSPKNEFIADGKYPAELAWKVLHGYTVILLKCATCGDQKIVEATGDARTA